MKDMKLSEMKRNEMEITWSIMKLNGNEADMTWYENEMKRNKTYWKNGRMTN